ncbi:arylsulfatase [Paraburkholderia aromaticivorans]|uniref:arylsulfatase n=1 Tax=Paraburkholderia aromaticivorans TaxID=2026199 RepID=UPI0038B9C414
MTLVAATFPAVAQQSKPNILIIWGDDIGGFNISAYNQGVMGYRTPNIDRIGREGALFTDWYGQQSCTAGRAAFITGQSPIRTGLTKVGLPGAPEGLQKEDVTLAELLKPQGYATGQFGKNHLGDRNEFLPTVHGFDESFGNLYHLNADEEPERADYPKNPQFKAKFGPRGVLHCFATDRDDTTVDPRFGKMGKQRCEDTGALTAKRMETVDDEITASTLQFMEKAHQEGKPFFIWWNASHMHVFTHLKPESVGKTGLGIYPDGMVEHDGLVGVLLKKLDDLGIANNTVVMYSTDNGAESMSWPDGGTTMFRGEKNTNWEGGYRVPTLMRWPGVIKPGTVVNDIGAHEDMIPTLMAATGDGTVKEDLLKGRKVGSRTFKVHLDGYNLLPALKGDGAWPRHEFIYWTDDGSVAALRYDQYKVTFLKQNAHGLAVWQQPFEELRAPMLANLRSDPFERAEYEGMDYNRWYIEHMFAFAPAAAYVGQWLQSFKDFPPRQKPGSFNLDRVMEAVTSQQTHGGN